jgi:hypothetical protein
MYRMATKPANQRGTAATIPTQEDLMLAIQKSGYDPRSNVGLDYRCLPDPAVQISPDIADRNANSNNARMTELAIRMVRGVNLASLPDHLFDLVVALYDENGGKSTIAPHFSGDKPYWSIHVDAKLPHE